MNPSANVLVFGDFSVHHKDWLTNFGRTDKPGELCYNFSISNYLTQVVIFLTRIPDCDSQRAALTGNSKSNSERDAPFLSIAHDYSSAYWDSIRYHLRDIPWEHIFKLIIPAAAASELYIPHRNYQVNPHSSPWFSAACAAVIFHRNHFYCLHQRHKSSESKVNFGQASNRCKWVLEAAKLAYAN